MKEELYSSVLLSEIDAILDGWEMEATFEKILQIVFSKIQDPAGTYKVDFSPVLPILTKIEETLKKTNTGYLCSFTTKPTLADLYCYGNLIPLNLLNFNFGSYSLTTTWFSGMHKQFGNYLSRDIQELVDEYGNMLTTFV